MTTLENPSPLGHIRFFMILRGGALAMVECGLAILSVLT